ncbi:MAG: PaaI family thioesterase [Flavobacteriales bacterium]|nr:PaaI family thioesterase [Flavobacteriales bacterium]
MPKNQIRAYFESMIDRPLAEGGTGFTVWLGGIIRKIDDGTISLEVTVRPEMCTPMGTLHGGIHAAILDEAVGLTVAAMGNEAHFVTLNMTTDMLRPAMAGEVVTAVTQVVKHGRKAIHVIASLYNVQGKELSRCTQNMMPVG